MQHIGGLSLQNTWKVDQGLLIDPVARKSGTKIENGHPESNEFDDAFFIMIVQDATLKDVQWNVKFEKCFCDVKKKLTHD